MATRTYFRPLMSAKQPQNADPRIMPNIGEAVSHPLSSEVISKSAEQLNRMKSGKRCTFVSTQEAYHSLAYSVFYSPHVAEGRTNERMVIPVESLKHFLS